MPNTYVMTKAAAEQLVKYEAEGLPITIFRPAIGRYLKNYTRKKRSIRCPGRNLRARNINKLNEILFIPNCPRGTINCDNSRRESRAVLKPAMAIVLYFSLTPQNVPKSLCVS